MRIGTRIPVAGNSQSMADAGSRAPTDGEEIAGSVLDPERFGIIVERHLVEIHRYLARRVGADAVDLAAETFATAFRVRQSFDTLRHDARPWLYGIATNVLRRHRRSEMRQLAAYARAGSMPAAKDDPTDSLLDRLDATAEMALVASAFAQLDEDQRDALYLVGVVGLSYDDAAAALGVKLGTLHSRVARGRRVLRDLVFDRGQVQGVRPGKSPRRMP